MYNAQIPSAEPDYVDMNAKVCAAQESLSGSLINHLDHMQEHASVLIERLARLSDRLIGSEPRNTEENVKMPGTLKQPVAGQLYEINDRINYLDDKLKEINYYLGRLETI